MSGRCVPPANGSFTIATSPSARAGKRSRTAATAAGIETRENGVCAGGKGSLHIARAAARGGGKPLARGGGDAGERGGGPGERRPGPRRPARGVNPGRGEPPPLLDVRRERPPPQRDAHLLGG